MATRAENAAKLAEALKVTIDTNASKPLAATLQGWADRLDTDADGVRREILTSQVEDALGVELTDSTLSPDTLAAILAQAQEDADAARTALQAALSGPPAAQSAASAQAGESDQAHTPEPTGETITVRVNDTIAGYGGTFTDPGQPEGQRVIKGEACTVQRTHAIRQGLLNGTLVLDE